VPASVVFPTPPFPEMAIFILVNLLKVNIPILTCMFISILHDIVLDRIVCCCIVLARGSLAMGSRRIERIEKRALIGEGYSREAKA